MDSAFLLISLSANLLTGYPQKKTHSESASRFLLAVSRRGFTRSSASGRRAVAAELRWREGLQKVFRDAIGVFGVSSIMVFRAD